MAAPRDGLQNTLRRGWYWGSQEFRERMLKLARRTSSNRNYRTSPLGREKGELDADLWLARTRKHFAFSGENLADAPRPVRLASAWALHRRTNQNQSRIAELLRPHSGANVSQQVRRLDSPNSPDWSKVPAWKKWRKAVKIC